MLCRRTAFPASGLVCPPQNPLRWRIQPDKGFLGSPTSSDFLRLCPMWLILLGFVGLSDHCPWPPTSSDCVRCGDSLIRFLASDGPPPFRSYIILYVNGDGGDRVRTPHCTGAPVPNGPPLFRTIPKSPDRRHAYLGRKGARRVASQSCQVVFRTCLNQTGSNST